MKEDMREATLIFINEFLNNTDFKEKTRIGYRCIFCQTVQNPLGDNHTRHCIRTLALELQRKLISNGERS